MALQGTFRDFGLADIFQLIGIQRKTGVLTLRHGGEEVLVSFLNGQIVYAETIHRKLEERIGALLVKTGKITAAQLQEALRIQTATLQRLGTVLLAQRMITQADLKDVLQVQMSQIIYNLFRWKDGEYHFSQEATVEHDPAVFTPLGAETVLMEGARMMDEWPIIERRIPSFDLVLRKSREATARVPRGGASVFDTDVDFGFGGPETPPPGIHLGPEEATVLRLLDGKKTVQEVIDRGHLGDFETCRILYDLLNRNVVEEATSGSTAGALVRSRGKGFSGALVRSSLAALAALSLLTIPWNPLSPAGGGSIITPDEVHQPVSRSRLSRIDLGLRVFLLEKQALPQSLEALRAEGILRAEDLKDPWGRPYAYRIDPARYEISGTGADGGVDSTLVVSNVFAANQRLVIEGGVDLPEAPTPAADPVN